VFCRTHERAPPGRRGGWLSAEMRRRKLAAGGELDASNITPGAGGRAEGPRRSLWVGGKPPFDRDLPAFDMVVLCAREIQPEQTAFHGYVVRCPLPDGPLSPMELRLALETSKLIAQSLVARRHVLVTCAQGINRSPFVASLALARVTRLDADALIRIMRKRRRSDAIANEHFQELLHRLIRR